MRRLKLLDGMRGYFLVFMLLNHIIFTGGLFLQKINHGELGFVQDAQGFVFMSGLILGLTYTKAALRGGLEGLFPKAMSRVQELYGYHMTLLLGLFAVALAVPATEAFWGDLFAEFYRAPEATIVGAGLLTYQPTFMDILPQYMLYILAAPFLVRWVLAGRGLEVALGSALLWFVAQTGLHLPLIDGIEALVTPLLPGFRLRSAFNPLGWQLVFNAGLLIGVAYARTPRVLEPFFRPDDRRALNASAALLAFFLVLKLGLTFGFIPGDMQQRIFAALDRPTFGLVYLVNFVAFAYAVTWLIRCGAASGRPVATALGRGLNGLFTFRPLVFLGQHSLQVYAYHVGLVYLLMVVDWAYGPFDGFTKTGIALAAIASLGIPATLHARTVRAAKRPPVAAGTAARPAPEPQPMVAYARAPARRSISRMES